MAISAQKLWLGYRRPARDFWSRLFEHGCDLVVVMKPGGQHVLEASGSHLVQVVL